MRDGLSCICTLLLAATVLSASARAEFIGKEECDKVREEVAKLELAGVRADMDRGPDWARKNLEPGRLRQIRSLIDAEEKLLFQCRTAKPSKDVEAAIDAALKPPPGAAKPADGAADEPAPDAAKPAKPAEPAAAAPGEPKPKKEKKVKREPKPKANDAFVPPAGTESTLKPPPGVAPVAAPPAAVAEPAAKK